MMRSTGVAGVLLLCAAAALHAQTDQTGKQIYETVCATCHGKGGLGDGPAAAALQAKPVSFAECRFANREPDSDFLAVATLGGPARGFSPEMPPHGAAYSREQLQAVLAYIRTLCTDPRWPRGELNLPRPFLTEKAYPEDEAVWTTSVHTEGAGAVMHEVLYEKRFGPVNQLEITVPFGSVEGGADDWSGGVGDVAVGVKRALYHSLEAGSILSVGAEVKLPTGSESKGLGKGTTVLEPFLSFGRLLPSEFFVHAQALAELVTDRDKGDHEAKWRAVLGRTFTQGEFGRAWSPMVELQGTAEFGEAETEVLWDVVPQMQVTLNTRQHVMLNVGLMLPLTEADVRSARFMIYLLWDWFDGGFFEGW